MRKLMIAAALGVASVSTMPAATAQISIPAGLVNVTIQDVSILNNFLNDSQIAALNNVSLPITVQVPIGVAANVCNISAAVLARQAADAAPCEARNGSRALAQVVNRQVLSQQD